jgi:hypothetical protein
MMDARAQDRDFLCMRVRHWDATKYIRRRSREPLDRPLDRPLFEKWKSRTIEKKPIKKIGSLHKYSSNA